MSLHWAAVGLPPHITATTGMDALTHAVEAYIGRSNTKETEQTSEKAVKLIFENLYEAYTNGNNLAARENMLKASYYAGIAFTRAYVGYVHAIAHPLGGFYGIPHGLANAVILPYVLAYYGESAHRSLAELTYLIGISEPSDTVEKKAHRFIQAIERSRKKSVGFRRRILKSWLNRLTRKPIPFIQFRGFSINMILPIFMI